ncbi:MAG TPA: hypothetical protein VMS77_09310 [Conexivisphaerales archaeon]|nr:hypothetical protein [Conexivisphaerales archaeon]
MDRETLSVIAGLVVLMLSLGASSTYAWVTSNSQGPITYSVRELGLPLPYVLFELSSPVGPSSYFKLDPLLLLVDLAIWTVIAYAALYFLKMPRRAPAKGQAPI